MGSGPRFRSIPGRLLTWVSGAFLLPYILFRRLMEAWVASALQSFAGRLKCLPVEWVVFRIFVGLLRIVFLPFPTGLVIQLIAQKRIGNGERPVHGTDLKRSWEKRLEVKNRPVLLKGGVMPLRYGI